MYIYIYINIYIYIYVRMRIILVKHLVQLTFAINIHVLTKYKCIYYIFICMFSLLLFNSFINYYNY